MGFGDIKLIIVVCLCYGFFCAGLGLIFAGVFAMLLCLLPGIHKNLTLPLAPFLCGVCLLKILLGSIL